MRSPSRCRGRRGPAPGRRARRSPWRSGSDAGHTGSTRRCRCRSTALRPRRRRPPAERPARMDSRQTRPRRNDWPPPPWPIRRSDEDRGRCAAAGRVLASWSFVSPAESHRHGPTMEFARSAAAFLRLRAGAWTRWDVLDKIDSAGISCCLRLSTRNLLPIEPTRRTMLALLGSLAPAAAFAAYPDRPIKLVVALAPGGPADTAARVFAPYLAEQLGQSVVIENRTGASSVIGTESVVRAKPDGDKLLYGSSSSFAVYSAVMKKLRFDVQKDLKLIGLVSYTPHVLVVRASLAANSLAELIALAKARPGKLTYASS